MLGVVPLPLTIIGGVTEPSVFDKYMNFILSPNNPNRTYLTPNGV
jgi:hypothetical protein